MPPPGSAATESFGFAGSDDVGGGAVPVVMDQEEEYSSLLPAGRPAASAPMAIPNARSQPAYTNMNDMGRLGQGTV